MGRTIPSVTYRMDSKFDKWRKFEEMLSPGKRQDLKDLQSKVKNYRSAILEADEADTTVPILLSMIVELKSELENLRDRVQLERIRGDSDVPES